MYVHAIFFSFFSFSSLKNINHSFYLFISFLISRLLLLSPWSTPRDSRLKTQDLHVKITFFFFRKNSLKRDELLFFLTLRVLFKKIKNKDKRKNNKLMLINKVHGSEIHGQDFVVFDFF